MSQPRVIKKYLNRRLYDTVDSKYITLADVRRLVTDGIDFVVIDKKTQEDITRSIMLQVITDQEHHGEPVMSQDFLSQVIRAYGSTMQGLVGSYLEQSLTLFMTQQQKLRERIGGLAEADPFKGAASLAERNLAQWQALQEQMLETLMGAAHMPGGGRNRKK